MILVIIYVKANVAQVVLWNVLTSVVLHVQLDVQKCVLVIVWKLVVVIV